MIYVVRPMRREDIPQVAEIDHEAFPTQWPPTPFGRELNSRLTRHLVAAGNRQSEEEDDHFLWQEGVRAEAGLQRLISRVRHFLGKEPPTSREAAAPNRQHILGYASLWLMLDEAHLTSIAVREAYRGRGIGELLLASVIDLALDLGAQVVTLEVRESNRPAQALYEKYGFNRVGVRRGYYTDSHEDAIVMTTDRITSASYRAHFQQLKQAHAQKNGWLWGVTFERGFGAE